MARVGVIGGGVVGLSAAFRLARAGHAVTLFEPDPLRRAASWGNAGHIATEQVAPLASPETLRSAIRRHVWFGGALDLPLSQIAAWTPFASAFVAASGPARFQRGQSALKSLLAPALSDWMQLAADLGRPDLVNDQGHLVVWESPATTRKGLAGWRAADIGRTTAAPTDASQVQALTARPLHGAIRFSGSGQVTDLAGLADALEAGLLQTGGRIARQAARLDLHDGRAVIAGHDADLVLVAAGVGSGDLMRPFGHRVPIIAERGYHIRAEASGWPADLPPVVFEDRSMIVTRYADCVQAASFVEFGRPNASPDPRKWERLERHVRDLGLPIYGPFRRWMGARPTLPDYLPAIGRSERASNLLYAFGHQHLGLTLAAVTARIVTALAGQAPSPVDVTPFSLSRFDRSPRP
ncbi:NAD(P)/FAD-dependent oxidoreductase [Brevundimonas sp. VNH65]|uniref:NAD(P)/FAD-dependent oxidoreductase n=1 Tax=Brevundimonas sp. VNH65 TaxID=3400917 RepID=UPI003C02CAAA